MNYSETLTYLYQNLPMFQRVGAVAFKKDLTNTLALCEVLGNPQEKFKSIHIAGTNGKGSTSHMLAAVLHSAGYKTGLYTSPHLKEFTERIRVTGQEVSQEFVVDFVERIKPAIQAIQPSFFEITVAMAFDYFAQKEVDIAIIETGLGGRLDSTNVIHPILSVITNISYDHMDLLGNTLVEIAGEKAGIIKHGVPVVISERQSEVEKVFIEKAKKENSAIVFAMDQYKVEKGTSEFIIHSKPGNRNYTLDLTGGYQQKNLAGVLAAIDQLCQQFTISDADVAYGLANTTKLTGLKGRWQKLSDKPLTICDTGHNEAGIKEILSQIRSMNYRQLHWVWGMVKDKDVTKILALLPKNAQYYFCEAAIPRAMTVEVLSEKAQAAGLNGVAIRDVNEALRLARQSSQTDDLILIGGSTFVVAELNEL